MDIQLMRLVMKYCEHQQQRDDELREIKAQNREILLHMRALANYLLTQQQSKASAKIVTSEVIENPQDIVNEDGTVFLWPSETSPLEESVSINDESEEFWECSSDESKEPEPPRSTYRDDSVHVDDRELDPENPFVQGTVYLNDSEDDAENEELNVRETPYDDDTVCLGESHETVNDDSSFLLGLSDCEETSDSFWSERSEEFWDNLEVREPAPHKNIHRDDSDPFEQDTVYLDVSQEALEENGELNMSVNPYNEDTVYLSVSGDTENLYEQDGTSFEEYSGDNEFEVSDEELDTTENSYVHDRVLWGNKEWEGNEQLNQEYQEFSTDKAIRSSESGYTTGEEPRHQENLCTSLLIYDNESSLTCYAMQELGKWPDSFNRSDNGGITISSLLEGIDDTKRKEKMYRDLIFY